MPFLVMPDSFKIPPTGIEIQRHTECACYFKRRRLFCLVLHEPEVQATDK